jgi:hypothetical protein
VSEFYSFHETVHVLKVTLRDVKPQVWRRIAVYSDTWLSDFARMLEISMGWKGTHLHLFDARDILFGIPDDDMDHVVDERAACVGHLLPMPKARLTWTYDFGDGWEHDIVVEDIMGAAPILSYPICIGGKRACPPEDCGGPGGYQEILKILGDPTDPKYSEVMQWLPTDFHPSRFNIVGAMDELYDAFGKYADRRHHRH